MLSNHTFLQRRSAPGRRQNGVVMVVSLIVLVVMTLAGIALMRSMDTSTMIAGNMAFKQAATHSADAGVESAIAWLEQENALNRLGTSSKAAGYVAASENNGGYLAKDFWKSLENSGVCHLNKFGQGCISTPEANANGNKISYMIQRLCKITGDAINAGCAVVSGAVVSTGTDQGAGGEAITSNYGLVYYRITVRVEGPRNSVSYVQSIITL